MIIWLIQPWVNFLYSPANINLIRSVSSQVKLGRKNIRTVHSKKEEQIQHSCVSYLHSLHFSHEGCIFFVDGVAVCEMN